MISWLRHLGRDDAGSTMLEYTLVLPAMLALVIGMMEIAWLGWAKATLDYATAEAARCATVRTDLCSTVAQIQSFGASQAAGLNVSAANFTVTNAGCGVMVSAQAGAGFIAYVLPKGLPNLTSRACRS
jgi:Flp pilus assembly protein TadG